VQRDNPQALAFWQAQGFGTAGCRMRIYPEPESGTVRSSAAAYVGALSSDLK
jgi:ribosomal protein S18 acetylase RimI-like enzyme